MKRYHNLSLFRLIATFAVVMFHVFFLIPARDIPYETLLRTFMLGLTALSGFLAGSRKNKDLKHFYLGKAKKTLFPALFCFAFMAIWVLVYFLFHLDGQNYFQLFLGPRPYNGETMFIAGNYYYLIFFAVCVAITPLLERSDKVSNIIVVLVITYEVIQSFFLTTQADSSVLVLPYVFGYYVGAKRFDEYVDPEKTFSLKRLLLPLGLSLMGLALYICSVAITYPDIYIVTCLQGLMRACGNFFFATFLFLFFIYAFRFLNKIEKEIAFFRFTDRIAFFWFLMNHCFFLGGTSVLFFDSFALNALMANAVTLLSAIALTYSYRFLEKRIKQIHMKKAQNN